MSGAEPRIDEPRIASAVVVAGHDGQAELAVDIAYPNGALHQTVFPVDALAPVLDAAGVTDVHDLVGRPWSVLLAGRRPSPVSPATVPAPVPTTVPTPVPATTTGTAEEPQPCST